MASDLVPGAYTVPGGETEGSYLQTLSGRIQDEASQLIPHLLGNILGWKIWDVCAAPGGKSAILREKCGGSGMVVSTDSSLSRAKKILSVVPGTTDSGAAVAVADARYSPPFLKSFDAVLADVPCSGLGTLRRNPDIKWRFKPERLLILQQLQQSILNSVSTLVRPGGFLLYSTCSVEPEENENVVCAFLAGNPEFALIRPEHPPGVEALLDERGFLRTYPGTRLWDGFFAALMERASTFQGRFRSV
jgi:16S rRNA (cytosine967-C5)-methyltransferase